MNNHSLAKVKLLANEFMQEYERQQTERDFQKQRLKQNIMIEIMSNRHKSQASQSQARQSIKADSRLVDHNSRTLSANLSRVAVQHQEQKKSLPNASRVSYGRNLGQPDPLQQVNGFGAEVTFKMPKNRDSYILVQGQSQNQQENRELQPSRSNIHNKPNFQSQPQSDRFHEQDFNSTLKEEPIEREQMTFRDEQPFQKPTERKFKLAEPQIQPDSEQHPEIQEEELPSGQIEEDSKDPGGVFLTMEQEESMELAQQNKKNCAFDIVMDKSEPIENMQELRRKKFEAMERQRQLRMEQFKKKEEIRQQKRLDTSLSKVRASQGGYSRKSQHKISEDRQPQPPRAVSRKKGDTRANLSSQNIVQEPEYSNKPAGIEPHHRASYMIPPSSGKRIENISHEYDHTPKTITSEARTKSRTKNTIFRESPPKRSEKSASKYSQDPKIEPKDRKNTFNKQSNKKLMITAITNVCLPGELNRKERQKLVEVLENDESEFFVFLFKDYSRKVIKAIYTLDHSQTILQKIYGEKAPVEISSEQVKTFYRFDSGCRDFKRLDGCKSFSYVVHAIDIR